MKAPPYMVPTAARAVPTLPNELTWSICNMCKYNKSAPYSTVHDYQSRDLLFILEKPDLEYTRFYIYNNDEIKADKTA